MNGQKHIIYREVLEVTVADRDRAVSIQNKASELIRQRVHPELDRLFSRLASVEETIRIDRLELDLGDITKETMDEEMVNRILKTADEKIRKLVSSDYRKAKPASVNGHPPTKENQVKVLTESEEVTERFFHFLQTGQLPWWNQDKAGSTFEDFFSKIPPDSHERIISRLRPLLKNPSIRKRLIFQFDVRHLDQLLEWIDPETQRAFKGVKDRLQSWTISTEFRTSFNYSWYNHVLLNTAEYKKPITETRKAVLIKDILSDSLTTYAASEKQAVLTDLLRQTAKQQDQETGWIGRAVAQLALELPFPGQDLIDTLQSLQVGKDRDLREMIKQLNNRNLSEQKKEKDPESGESVNGKATGIPETESTKEDTPLFTPKPLPDEETILINNAGLVLFYPFLKFFFGGLQLLDDQDQFKSEATIYKAVHLLQFLVSGQETTPENELGLNKILCGLPVTEPVPKSMALSEKEKEECTHLLKTVLGRWDALKTTNPEALRETYLKREGLLKQAGGGWNLYIERNTFDVMLDKLPWTFSIIKLPWSNQILYVEW